LNLVHITVHSIFSLGALPKVKFIKQDVAMAIVHQMSKRGQFW